jgi:hypothetical protein
MLRDLKIPRGDTGRDTGRNTGRDTGKDICKDSQIACHIVDILFNHVNNCLQRDRSRVKLNALTKGMISGVLGRTRDGTKEYLGGIYPEDLERLLDDMEKELAKRSRKR